MKKISKYSVIAFIALLCATVFSACVSGGGNEAEKYTVIFETSGGSSIARITNIESGSKIGKPTPDPTYDGHIFDGWFKESSLINPWVFDTDVVTKPVTLYAKWLPDDDGELIRLMITGLEYDGATKTVSWDKVGDAVGYSVLVGATPIEPNLITEENGKMQYILRDIENNWYWVSVKALGDGVTYSDSDKEELHVHYEAPVIPEPIEYTPFWIPNAEYGAVYEKNIATAVSTAQLPIAYEIMFPLDGLPEGLSLSADGLISGTVTGNAGNYNFTITASCDEGSVDAVFSLIVDKKIVNVQYPSCADAQLVYGDPLPEITTTTQGGTVSFDANQTLQVGNLPYYWTFTPENTVNYEYRNSTGSIYLSVQRAQRVVVQPEYSGEPLVYGDPLPEITTTTQGGTVELNEGQVLSGGVNLYNWTFTPVETDNYEYSNVTGTIELTVLQTSQAISDGVVLEATIVDSLTKVALTDLGGDYEYSVDNQNWQPSNIFDGLTQDDTVVFYARLKETADFYASDPISVERQITPVDSEIYQTRFYQQISAISSLTSLGRTLKTLVIPKTIGGKNITSIDEGAFGYSAARNIVVPDFNFVDVGAFKGCNSLESITLPYVGRNKTATNFSAVFGYIFGYTTNTSGEAVSGATYQYYSTGLYYHYSIPSSLKTVILTGSNSVDAIVAGAFRNCDKLENITLPAGLKTINSEAFANCIKLSEPDIPESVKTIGSSAYQNCVGLTSLVIPGGTTAIGIGAFRGCSGLESIETVSNTEYITINNCLIQRATGVLLAGCNNSVIEGAAIAYVKGIGSFAFENCTGLTEIYLPSNIEHGIQGVRSISEGAFAGCTGLTEIIVPDTVLTIGNGAFKGCSNLRYMSLPFAGYNSTATSFNSIFDSVIPLSLKTVAINGGNISTNFYNCGTLTTIIVGSAVTFDGFSNPPHPSGSMGGCNAAVIWRINVQNADGDQSNGFVSRVNAIIIPVEVTSIDSVKFQYFSSPSRIVYYGGSLSDWSGLTVTGGGFAGRITSATRYYYSESFVSGGQHWHYDEQTGVPVVWQD